MAGITLAQAEAQLALYIAAEAAVMERGQSFTIKGRSLTRANLKEIREGISYWQSMTERLDRDGGIQRRRITIA